MGTVLSPDIRSEVERALPMLRAQLVELEGYRGQIHPYARAELDQQIAGTREDIAKAEALLAESTPPTNALRKVASSSAAVRRPLAASSSAVARRAPDPAAVASSTIQRRPVASSSDVIRREPPVEPVAGPFDISGAEPLDAPPASPKPAAVDSPFADLIPESRATVAQADGNPFADLIPDGEPAALPTAERAGAAGDAVPVAPAAPQFAALPDDMAPGERGLIDYHRKHLREGTFLDDEQGLTTVYITGVTGPDGRIYNVPGYADGKRLSPEEAAQRAAQVGWENFPAYATGEESNVAAQNLHHIIEQDGEAFRSASRPKPQPHRPTGRLPRITAPTPGDVAEDQRPEATGEDSWADLGRKVIENTPAGFQSAVGGALEWWGENMPVARLGAGRRALERVKQLPPEQRDHDTVMRTLTDEIANDPAAVVGSRIYSEAQADLKANAPNVDPESAKGYAYDIAYATIQMVPMLATALATKSPAAGLTVMGGQVAGQKYGESRAKGRTPDQAQIDAAFTALAETLPERIPLGILMRPGGKFIPRILKAAAAEGIQEPITQLLQMAYDAGVLDEKMTWGEALTALKRAAIVGAGAGGSLAIISHPFVGGAQPAQPAQDAQEQQPATPTAPQPETATSAQDMAAPETDFGQTDAPAFPEGSVPAETVIGADPFADLIPEQEAAPAEPAEEITPQPTETAAQEPVEAPEEIGPALRSPELINRPESDVDPAPEQAAPAQPAETEAVSETARAADTTSPETLHARFARPILDSTVSLTPDAIAKAHGIETGDASRLLQEMAKRGDIRAVGSTKAYDNLVKRREKIAASKSIKPAARKATLAKLDQQIAKVGSTVRYRRPPKRGPLTLSQFIASKGGISDPGGELKAMDLGNRTMIPGFGPLVRSKGVAPDYVREAAVEAGYLPEGASIDDLLEAIRRDTATKDATGKVFSAEDQTEVGERIETARAEQEEARERDAREEIRAAASEAGLPLDPTDEKGALARVMGGEDALDVLADIWERSALQWESHDTAAAEDATGRESEEAPPFGDAAGRESGAPQGSAQAGGAGRQARRDDAEAGRGEGQPSRVTPTTEQTSQGTQAVMPGMERSARQAQAAREAEGRGRIRPRTEQQEPGGMFAERRDPDDEPGMFQRGGDGKVITGTYTAKDKSGSLRVTVKEHGEIKGTYHVTAYRGDDAVGDAWIGPNRHDKAKWSAMNLWSDADLRRQGIATAIYDVAVAAGMKPLIPDTKLSDAAIALWGRQRQVKLGQKPRPVEWRPTQRVRRAGSSDGGAFQVSRTDQGTVETIGDPARVQIRFRFTPQFDAKREAVYTDLRKELSRFGLRDIRLRVPDAIEAIVEGRETGEQFGGHYLARLIDVSLKSPDAKGTLRHEAIHAMRDLGLFTEAEWATLERAAKADWMRRYRIRQKYDGLTGEQQLEEAVAEAFGAWRRNDIQSGGKVKAAFRKIVQIMRAIGNAFRKSGFQTADDVFARIERGEVGARERAGEERQEGQLHRTRAAAEETARQQARHTGYIYEVYEQTGDQGPVWIASGGRIHARDMLKAGMPVEDLPTDLQAWVRSQGATAPATTAPPSRARETSPMQEAAEQMSLFQRLDPEVSDSTTNRQTAAQGFLSKGQPIDRAMRLPFDWFGGVNEKGEWKPGAKLFDKAETKIKTARFSDDGAFRWMNGPLENARRGLIDRYGLDPEYVKRERRLDLDKREIAEKGAGIIKSLAESNIGAEEAKVLQAVLTGEEIPTAEMGKLSAPIRQAIDELGAEAVSLGLVSPESYQRNRGTYLHRVYLKHEGDQPALSRWFSNFMTGRRKKIQGDAFKGRGMFLEVPVDRAMQDVSEFREGRRGPPVKGEKFTVLDKYADQGTLETVEPATPKIERRIYWPADQKIPDRYKDFADQGTWEVRAAGKGKVTLWRDFTKPERERMGEILDARYTIGKTFMLMAQDLSTGRFYRDIAANHAWTRTATPNGKWVNATEFRRLWQDESVEWVKVPDIDIPNTGGKKRWGALAGKFVRAEIWRDLNEADILSKPNLWTQLLTQWKLNKTARSPVVHMNNVLSNMVFMDLADVRMQDLVSGIRAYVNETADFREAQENGAFGSDIISQEIRREVLQPILDDLQKQVSGGGNPVTVKFGVLGKVAEAVWSTAKAADRKMVNLYRMEDEIFRMAMYMRRRSLGDSAENAALEAKDQFLDYDIRAPWVNAARRSVLPFIAYTYRAVPVIARSIATRPWKLAKYFLIAQAAGYLAYMVAPGDEDEERRSMREEERGYTWIGVERMMRMPYRDAYGNPVFLDIRRWIPAGDVFDTNQGSSAFAIPAPIQFGGPLMLAAELMLNKSAFTGDPIVNELTDTGADKAGKIADWAWKSWMPSAAWIPGSWYWRKIGLALDGATDSQGRPYPVPEAVASSFGVKLKPQDVESNLDWRAYEFDKARRALRAEERRLARQRDRNIISEEYFEEALDSIDAKRRTLDKREAEVFPPRR